MPYQQQLLLAQQRHSKKYQQASFIIEEIGQRLLSRLAYFRLPPQTILDLGCGQGIDTQLLTQAYPGANITAVDFCFEQFQHWSTNFSFDHVSRCIADCHNLPLPAQQFDLVFANLLTPAIVDYQSFWQECQRVLKPGGILLFSVLGSDTLHELKQCFAQFGQADCINVFPDMHDIGDGLAAASFADPAIEGEKLSLHYSSLKKLLTELKSLGSVKIWQEYPHLYKNRNFWQQLEKYYQHHFVSEQNKLIATLEVCYAIAFAPNQRVESPSSVSIPLTAIKRRH